MRPVYLILGIPVVVFISLTITLDLGTLLAWYPDFDLTPYLAARSLGKDLDLTYTRIDSDRFFLEEQTRPSHFYLVQKKMISSSGGFRVLNTFYAPDLYVFALAPFAGWLSFRGLLLFHCLLLAFLYGIGYIYYNISRKETSLPALNSVVYYTLVPLPLLFLIPSHHLYLFVVLSAGLFFGLRNRPILAGVFFSIAWSSQPWSILFALFLFGCWQTDTESGPRRIARMGFALLAAGFVVWGIQHLMYPRNAVSEIRFVSQVLDRPISEVWNTLPVSEFHWLAVPSGSRVFDFLAGRTAGFLIYGCAAACLFLSTVWLWRDFLVRRALVFVLFFLIAVSFSDPSCWNVVFFANDFWIMLAALPFFVVPLIRPRNVFLSITVISIFMVGPLLVNPLGAIVNRNYYLQAFPYKLFPMELSLLGKVGLTKNPVYQMHFDGFRIYFLDDHFYQEKDFFWIRGGSTLEFLLEMDTDGGMNFRVLNGALENRILFSAGSREWEFQLPPGGGKSIQLDPSSFKRYEGRYYVHGKIKSTNGFVPKLLSRDNPDYRYLGCQVYLMK